MLLPSTSLKRVSDEFSLAGAELRSWLFWPRAPTATQESSAATHRVWITFPRFLICLQLKRISQLVINHCFISSARRKPVGPVKAVRCAEVVPPRYVQNLRRQLG